MTGLTRFSSLGGAGFTVGSPYADKFKALVDDLEAAGYKIDPRQSGGYNYRNIAGTNRLSNHAYGRAIDINWTDNARGTKGKIDPDLARTLAQKHGMVWGGDWSNPDPMHFEIAGALNAAGGQHNHSHSPASPSPSPTPTPAIGGAQPMTTATPESVAQARAMAQALMSQGLSGQPVQHWTQALGRVLQAGVGGMWQSQAAQDEAAGKQEANAQLAAALANPKGAVSSLTSPWLGNARNDIAMAQVKQKLGLGADKPAVIQNYEYREGLSPEKQAIFDRVQRSGQYLDLGTEYKDPRTNQTIAKDLRGKEREEKLGAAEGAVASGLRTAARSLEAYKVTDDAVNSDIDRSIAIATENKGATGIASVVTGRIPGASGYNLKKAINSIKANIGFDKLQQMRENSPTGGALGQVAVQELEMLHSVFGELDTAQDQQTVIMLLNRVKDIRAKYRELKERAFAEDMARFGGAAAPNPVAPVTTTPRGGRSPSGLKWEPVD